MYPGVAAAEDLREAIAGRAERARQRIAAACARAGRDPLAVTVVAVTKGHSERVAAAAVAAGLHDLGENRVQELLGKLGRVEDARWHLIGQLQTNKARWVVGRAVLVHSLDRAELADTLARRARALDVVQRVLVQVDLAGIPSRGGCPPERALELIGSARELPGLSVEGLMTMPPAPSDPARAAEEARPYFARLRELRDEARANWPEVVHLSMGMSSDLEAAVEEGATIVRVGTALLGPRPATTRRTT